MATASNDISRLRDVFESVTGQSAFTETQRVDVPVRIENLDEGQAVSAYLQTTIRADGLDDAIAEPDEF